MYSAAIFDLDGLVLDTETVSYAAWRQVTADLGFVLEDKVYHKIIGLGIPDAEKVFTDAFGPDFPFERANQQRLEFMYSYIETHPVSVKPGLLELLDFLDRSGLPKALATSSIRALTVRLLGAAGLAGRFEVIVCGDEVRNGKPSPEPFLQAAERLNIAPEKCLVFEDSENGVCSAHAAGMTVLIVPDHKQPSEQIAAMAERVFGSLADAIPFLKERIR
jgi:HAD superfamily hydrolase (TIGR01509 family)